MKNRIVVFDFDNTLFNTVDASYGRVIYRKKTGKNWEHNGWYNREESLDDSIFPIRVDYKIRSEYEKYKKNESDCVCMISERPVKVKDKIEYLLKKNDFDFDFCFYRESDEDYFKIKCDQIKKILSSNQNINSIIIFDDKSFDVDRFKVWSKKFFQNIEVNLVKK